MTEDPKQLAAQLAEALNETEEIALQQIELIVERFSPEFAIDLYHEVEQIEASGGMLTKHGERRRTPGGVYLYLARERAQTGKQRRIFYPNTIDPHQIHKFPGSDEPEFVWESRLEILNEIIDEHGEATTVKLTLIGRPGKIARRRDMVVTTISHINKRSVTLPKGVPLPPAEPTVYTVYISAKQWNKVEQSITDNPDDALIIEGLCAYDPEIQGIAVFAQSVMSRRIQNKNAQRNAAKQNADQPQEQPTAAPASGMSLAEAKQRLTELRRAEAAARETLEELKSLPPEEQVGMARTLQDLQRIKEEIKLLRQQHPELG